MFLRLNVLALFIVIGIHTPLIRIKLNFDTKTKLISVRSYYIIEKDKFSIQSIENTLVDFPELKYSGYSENKEDAMNCILKEHPDLVFLNIDNVVDEPFEFIMEVGMYSSKPPLFVALSTSKDHAYQVIKHGFLDFLIKPLVELDIRKCILKYQKKYVTELNKTICLKSYKDYHYLNTDEILFLKADNNTTDFYMKDNAVVGAFKTLRTFEEILPENFLRIHKSYIINSNYVSRIQYGKSVCTLNEGNCKIPFTKTFLKNIEVINNSLYRSSYMSFN